VSTAIRVAVIGAAGRLGNAIVTRLAEDDRFEVTAAVVREESDLVGKKALGNGKKDLVYSGWNQDWQNPQIVIDASTPDSVVATAERAAQIGTGLIVAVTALTDVAEQTLQRASTRIPVLIAPNLSLGVAWMVHLVGETARRLSDYEIEISEIHHSKKRDSPSGTALWLGRAAAEARGLKWPESARNGRSGAVGPRPRDEIGMHSLRAGSTVGEHRVWFGGPGEHLEITHVAENLGAFASGALTAALWLASAQPGGYTIGDLVDGR
jgi:4-hydroxy-tetrahydrodipicolinate reductase